VVIQVSMETKCKSVGIEKEPDRHKAGLRLLEQFESELAQRVTLHNLDLNDKPDITDTTVVFTNNLCFTQELQMTLLDLFGGLKRGTKIICTKSFFGQ